MGSKPTSKRRPKVKTEKKRIRELTKAEIKARLKAVAEFKKSAVGTAQSLREHMGKFIDSAKIGDVTKLVAILGMTVLVKNVIDSTPELVDKAKELVVPGYALALLFPFTALPFLPALGAAAAAPPKEQLEIPEHLEWLISFTLAYIIVTHFGDLVQGMGNVVSGIKGILTSMLLK